MLPPHLCFGFPQLLVWIYACLQVCSFSQTVYYIHNEHKWINTPKTCCWWICYVLYKQLLYTHGFKHMRMFYGSILLSMVYHLIIVLLTVFNLLCFLKYCFKHLMCFCSIFCCINILYVIWPMSYQHYYPYYSLNTVNIIHFLQHTNILISSLNYSINVSLNLLLCHRQRNALFHSLVSLAFVTFLQSRCFRSEAANTFNHSSNIIICNMCR